MSTSQSPKFGHRRPGGLPGAGKFGFNNTRDNPAFAVPKFNDGNGGNKGDAQKADAHSNTTMDFPAGSEPVHKVAVEIYKSQSDAGSGVPGTEAGIIVVHLFEEVPPGRLTGSLVLGPSKNLDANEDDDCAFLVFRFDGNDDQDIPIYTLVGANCGYVGSTV
jgi:hypothetical protein